MTKKAGVRERPGRARRRTFTEVFRREAVQMMLDGHSSDASPFCSLLQAPSHGRVPDLSAIYCVANGSTGG